MVLSFLTLCISWMLQSKIKNILGHLVDKEDLLLEKKGSIEYGSDMFILV